MPSLQSFIPAVTLLVTSLSAQADVLLATGGVFGGSVQNKAYCYVYNGSTKKPIGIVRSEIVRQDGIVLPIDPKDNTCDVAGSDLPHALSPSQTCIVASKIQNDAAYGCRIVLKQKSRTVRGTLDIRDSNEQVLVSSALR